MLQGMVKAIDVIRAHKSKEPSQWKEQAQWHRDNWAWLKHSIQIALKAKKQMNALGMTQKELAEQMGCSQQYVSLILKGKENLTLETISRLETVLDIDLINNTPLGEQLYSYPSLARPSTYLSEGEEPLYGKEKD